MKGKFLVYSLVAAISIASCTFFVCQQFDIVFAKIIALSTFLFAFFTYTLDHYYDAKSARSSAVLHLRHVVSEKHYKIALQGLALSALVSFYLFTFMPLIYMKMGLGLGLVSGIYFGLIFKIKINKTLKQLLSAAILSLVIGVWCLVDFRLANLIYLVIIFLAVWNNLLFFGYIDKKYDATIGKVGSIKFFERKYVLALIALASVLLIFMLGFLIGSGQTWMFVPAVYLALLFLKPICFKSHTARLLLDLVMLLPLIKWVF